MVAHAPQPTTFESAVKAAMKEQPGLGLVMEMAPEIQKRELQLWQSLAWIRSEFDRMIKVGIPAAKVDGDIKLYRSDSVPDNLEDHSHVVVQTQDIKILHELLFVCEQLALANPARIANKLRSRLLSQWNLPEFQTSAKDEHSLFSQADMAKAAKAAKVRDEFSSATSSAAKRRRQNGKNGKKKPLFQRPLQKTAGGGSPSGSGGKQKTRALCKKCKKWHAVGGKCK
jgi:hypothetical protein